ncbi:DUF3310 domain-containing protein [Staphylococcus saprophyticus]|uniref:DUF3310 domain-containing protein n=1 Tax=Staphylococcus saprophyticus TaxID=29385 RepID=UPI002979ECD4|nr:DUF3310 domain-containing protein [Staphylococcus saprophyticus]
MKIRDLDLDQYVIVYDIGKSEHSEGMTVVGRVEEIVFNDDNDNVATINSLGNLYKITDNNDFDLWSKSIEDKTESVSDKSIPKAGQEFYFDAKDLGPHNFIKINNQSNDLQQRKRNEQNTKPDYYQFDDFEMYEIVEAICKHYNPVVAAWIGQAIQYIGRAPRKNGKEDIGKARDMIERAFEVWDVK